MELENEAHVRPACVPVGSRRRHILFIVPSLAVGGAERHTVTLLNHIDTGQFRMSLAYLKPDDSLLVQVDPDRLEGRVFHCDVRAKVDLVAIRHLSNLIADQHVDTVVGVNCFAYAYALLASKLVRSRPALAAVFHSTQMLTRADRVKMAIYKPLFARCDHLVYVCENQRAYWQGRGLMARHSTVIHNGIDTGQFCDIYSREQKQATRAQAGFTERDFVIGVCAAMRPEKAHADLLRALAGLGPRFAHVKCLLIGDGPERPAIEAAVQALGLSRRVAISGFVDDVRPLVAACDAMAMVSHTEAFSLAVLESMALAKPMLMTAVGGATEQIEHGVHGFLVMPGAVCQMTERLAELADVHTARIMGQRARERVVHRFSHHRMIARYQEVLSGAGSAASGRDRKFDRH